MFAAARFTHIDENGDARMVDINAKAMSVRSAQAQGLLRCEANLSDLLDTDVLVAAEAAGIQAAKRTPHLIPLCHQIPLGKVRVKIEMNNIGASITAEVDAYWKTGVEIEALTAVTVTALTLQCAVAIAGHRSTIDDITIWRKSGGKSGPWGRSVPS